MPPAPNVRRFVRGRRGVAVLAGTLALVGVVTVVVTAGHGRDGDRAIRPSGPTVTTVAGERPGNAGAQGGQAAQSQPVGAVTAPAPGTTAAVADRSGSAGTTTSTTAAAQRSLSLEPLGGGWVTLASLRSGDGDRSAVFHLRNANTRLRYRSEARSVTVYVVDAVKGTDATAGFADAECAGACDESYMALNDPPGDYYLMVRSDGGPWVVDISEHP